MNLSGTFSSAKQIIHGWYEKNLRDLPMRQTRNPYHTWVAEVDGTPAAFNFMWTWGTHLNYVYNASDPDYVKYNPNNVLQWDMIRHYKSRGFTSYNLWGLRNMNLDENHELAIDRSVAGYGRFKLSLGPEVVDLIRYIKL